MNINESSHSEDPFSRQNESDDATFYSKDRMVSHLDAMALATVKELIGRLVVQERPVILDLMASWDSHIPDNIRPSRAVGLGLNENELAQNAALSEYLVHDLNSSPQLPLENDSFDAVLCTVSVDYLTRPVEIFQEVGRILRPGGLFLVIFSNRFFPSKVVSNWRRATEDERLKLVLDYFLRAKTYATPRVYVSKDLPRPADDKYAALGIPSDPIYAVYAEKSAVNQPAYGQPRKQPARTEDTQEEINERKRQTKHTLRCPYCGDRLEKWIVPESPFIEWPNEFFFVCFNDECAYFVRGWDEIAALGNLGSYRFVYDPLKDKSYPVPVTSPTTARG